MDATASQPVDLAAARAQRARLQSADRATPADTRRAIGELKVQTDRLDRMAAKTGGLTQDELDAAVERLQHLIDRIAT